MKELTDDYQDSGSVLAIETKDLGKCYRIYESPKERLKQAIFRNKRQYFREFWALRHVSLQIEKGESIGIIGRNGSGKSTLLQLICGTLTPTEGVVKTNGRIAALLELGSGFNPEFTGMENVYLNASLFGLSKSQIEERLDDILAFADIGDFVDQPVKMYSSGMVVRLAFGVIANVEPEILVVDEALAVGDAVFTQKCMQFIHRVRERNSLLFVSHDPASVASFCDQCLWIEKGEVRQKAETRIALNAYLKACYSEFQDTSLTNSRLSEDSGDEKAQLQGPTLTLAHEMTGAIPTTHPAIQNQNHAFRQSRHASSRPMSEGDSEVLDDSYGDGAILIEAVELRQRDMPEVPVSTLKGGEVVVLEVKARCQSLIQRPSICGFNLVNERGLILFGENTFTAEAPLAAPLGNVGDRLEALFSFTMPPLQPGAYFINVAWASGTQKDHTQHHYINSAIQFVSTAHLYRPIMGLFACDVHEICIFKSCEQAISQEPPRSDARGDGADADTIAE